MEEILLRHRALVDAAVASLEETSPIDGFLGDLDKRVATLRLCEPSFWELRVVEYIHRVVSTELKVLLRNDVATKEDIARVKESVRAHLSDQLARLLELVGQPELHQSIPDQREHFLDSFWDRATRLHAVPTSNQVAVTVYGGGEADMGDDQSDAPPEQASYEAIAFDDLQFETGSVNSAPSTEEIPQILEAFTATSAEDRRAALHRLAQISPMELVHCDMLFSQIMQSLCGLVLDSEEGIAMESLRQVYNIICHIDDPTQFIDLFFVIVDWIGSTVSAKELRISATDLFNDQDTTIRAVDAFRLLHLMICRVPYHWIHVSSDVLTRVLCSTFVVLMLDPPPSNNKKMCRPLDVLAAIDPEAKWFVKWTLKVPSRAQLFASLDQTGFISDFLYYMTRIRPFELEPEPFERCRTANMLTILATCAEFHAGEHLLANWTKFPAHLQQQARYKEWLGLNRQFQVETVPDENDKLYVFHRADHTIKSAHGVELEDGGPLGDQAIMAITLSAIVLYSFNPIGSDTLRPCLKRACRSLVKQSSHQNDISLLFELVLYGGLGRQSGAATSTSGAEELEGSDPWFPFRRPKSTETVVKYIQDTATKRGFVSAPFFTRKCARVFECLVEGIVKMPSMTPRLAFAVSHGLQGYLRHVEEESSEGIQTVLSNLAQMMESTTSPSTTGHALATTSILSQLSDKLEQTSDHRTQEVVVRLVHATAASGSTVPALAAAGLWKKCMHHFVEAWRTSGHLDVQVLQLLLLPSVSQILFQSGPVETTLCSIEQACVQDLDFGVAINSVPSEAPFQLRVLSRTIATLRAALASQFAATVFASSSTALHNFLGQSMRRHSQGTCRPNPQTEDLCTVGLELLTAAAGCIPSMVGIYEIAAQCQGRSLLPVDDDSMSACSWLACSLNSSLSHIGGHPSHWARPQPLYKFSTEVAIEREVNLMPRRTPPTVEFTFNPTTTCTLEQMMASIKESTTRHVPLDMVMLSQATWEILADVEKISRRDVESYRALTHALGITIHALAMSGQGKIGEGGSRQAGMRSADSNPAQPTAIASFPSDGERKLMNIYYKDYCSRLGLKATPTMLHVLSKVFGAAAMDCFSCTMLMILDQTHSENDIIEFLQYCATCPNIYALWPRILDTNKDQDFLALLPLVQAAEMILEIEFPQIFVTLRHCHCSVLALMLRWHSQCYWNFLPWDNILIMVYLTFLYGVEFQAYFFVVVVRHFEPTIRMIISRNGDDTARAYVETLQTPIEGFRFHTARNMFLTLRSTYHDRIQDILRR